MKIAKAVIVLAVALVTGVIVATLTIVSTGWIASQLNITLSGGYEDSIPYFLAEVVLIAGLVGWGLWRRLFPIQK